MNHDFGSDITDFDYLATHVPFGSHAQDMFNPLPKRGIFELNVDNRKKRGRSQPVKRVVCEGTLYGNGHVNLDTQELPVRDFRSFQQMEKCLELWGHYTLFWLVE